MKYQEQYGRGDPYLKFHGAIENDVTGTMHVYTTFVDDTPFRVSLDAGIQQGWGINPLDQKKSGLTSLPDSILMTHSHLDHCGNLPLLVKEGFSGEILGTEETLKGIHIALIDSLVIMRKRTDNTHGKNMSNLKTTLREYQRFVKESGPDILKGKHLYWPHVTDNIKYNGSKDHFKGIKHSDDVLDYHELYLKYVYELKKYNITCSADIDNLELANNYLPFDTQDIANTVSRFKPIQLEKEIVLKEGRDNRISTVFINAGHILGSAQIMLKDKLHGNIWFTGDLGRLKETLYLRPPVLPGKKYGKIDTLISESTYGNKLHPPRIPEQKHIMDLITKAQGNVLVAAFSNNRHQDFQQFFADTRDSKEYERFASVILCDGYTSEKFTYLFNKHAKNLYTNLNHSAFTRAEGKGTERSEKYLTSDQKTIVITSSGMMNGGAVEAYMHRVLSDPKSLLLITGYQSSGSRGEQILNTGKYKLNGIFHEVKCQVYQCSTFSSHADQGELKSLIRSVEPQMTYLVHGEMISKQVLQEIILNEGLSKEVCIPTVKGLKHFRLGG